MYEKELFKAIRVGDLDAVKKWKEKGSDLNARGENDYLAIEAAAWLNKIDIVEYLINVGADLSVCDAAKLAGMWRKDFPTVNNQAIKCLILNFAVSFRYIEKAREEAERRQGVLIYRDIDGTFSLTPPVDSVNRHTNVITPEIKTPLVNLTNHQRQPKTMKDKINQRVNRVGSFLEVVFDCLSLSLDGPNLVPKITRLFAHRFSLEQYPTFEAVNLICRFYIFTVKPMG